MLGANDKVHPDRPTYCCVVELRQKLSIFLLYFPQFELISGETWKLQLRPTLSVNKM